MITDSVFYLAAIPAVILFGLSKGALRVSAFWGHR